MSETDCNCVELPDDDFTSAHTVEEYRDFVRRFIAWTEWTNETPGPYPDTWANLAKTARRLLDE